MFRRTLRRLVKASDGRLLFNPYNGENHFSPSILMIMKVSVTTLRQRLGGLLYEVQHPRRRILITKWGKPVAALVDIESFERLLHLDEEFDHLTEEIAVAFSGQPSNEVDAWIDAAVTASRTRSRTLERAKPDD